MYKLSKQPGYGGTVVVENTERKTYISLGSATNIELINKIKDVLGVETKATDPDHGLDLFKEWDIEINESDAKRLCDFTFRIRKPGRRVITKAQVATTEQQPKLETEQPKKQIDALDVLLGLANY